MQIKEGLYTKRMFIYLFLFCLQLTYADISFFDFFNGYIAGGQPTIPRELQKFPLLAEHYNRVLNVPEIKTWIAKRPASFFWTCDQLKPYGICWHTVNSRHFSDFFLLEIFSKLSDVYLPCNSSMMTKRG